MFPRRLWINLLCEFGPVVAFLIAFELSTFRFATVVMVGTVAISFLILRLVEGHTPYFALLNTITVIVFGGLSAYINIPGVFICRDTLFDLGLGIAFLLSLKTTRPGLQVLFGNVFAITDRGWKIFTKRWALFYIFLACVNAYVQLSFDASTWVAAKVGMIVITFIFGMYQLTLTARERLPLADRLGLVR